MHLRGCRNLVFEEVRGTFRTENKDSRQYCDAVFVASFKWPLLGLQHATLFALFNVPLMKTSHKNKIVFILINSFPLLIIDSET